MREILEASKVESHALKSISNFHADIVREVKMNIAQNKIVVIGMAQNPVVGKAKKILDAAKLDYKYLSYGSYLAGWKPRLAIKLWSGWPTFPQVFIDGNLIGGAADLETWLKTHSLK